MDASTSSVEGVEALLDRAEAMLSLAGEPSTTLEYLLHAHTAMLLATLRAASPAPKSRPSKPVTPLPSYLRVAADGYGYDYDSLVAVMQDVERIVPDWEQRKIHAIKEVRMLTGFTLKDAKDLIDFSAQNPNWFR